MFFVAAAGGVAVAVADVVLIGSSHVSPVCMLHFCSREWHTSHGCEPSHRTRRPDETRSNSPFQERLIPHNKQYFRIRALGPFAAQGPNYDSLSPSAAVDVDADTVESVAFVLCG